MWAAKSREVVESASSLLSLVDAKKSLQEARDARSIAILATVYLPLSVTAGILSMGGDFILGKPKFWIFFVISLPILLISLTTLFFSEILEYAKTATSGFKSMRSRRQS